MGTQIFVRFIAMIITAMAVAFVTGLVLARKYGDTPERRRGIMQATYAVAALLVFLVGVIASRAMMPPWG